MQKMTEKSNEKAEKTQVEGIIWENKVIISDPEAIQEFYVKFISKYPNWVSIDKESINNLENFLKPIGLNKQRADRIKKLVQFIRPFEYKIHEIIKDEICNLVM